MKKVLASGFSFFSLLNVLVGRAYAQGVDLTPPVTVVNPAGITISSIIKFVINLLIIVGFVAALAFLIYGGIKWIISGGEKGKVEAARNQIVAAIVGLIVVVLAWVIINILLNLLIPTGGGIGQFQLPTLK